MNAQHTPGPWVFGGAALHNKWLVWHQDPNNPQHTSCVCEIDNCPQSKANARLIAVAPTYHELIQRALSKRIDEQWLKDARSAVSTATGEA